MTRAAILVAVSVVFAPLASAQTANDLVRVEVRVQTDQERKDIKSTTVDTVTQHKSLFITISGKAKAPETRTGKWIAYGRDLKGRALDVLESGEFKVDLASGPQKIESKKVSTTYTPDHAVVSTSGSSRSRRTTAKKVAAEGKKFAGYVVTVKDGDKIVGQWADPPGLERETK